MVVKLCCLANWQHRGVHSRARFLLLLGFTSFSHPSAESTPHATFISKGDGRLIRVDAIPEVLSFEDWEQIFRAPGGRKAYLTNSERVAALAKFQATVRHIRAHNADADRGLSTYRLGVNQFSDMTPQEFHVLISRPYRPPAFTDTLAASDRVADDVAPFTPIDWRTKGAVTPVKNQGTCGSCWAFSSTGSAEGAFFIATGTLRSLSEEQLVECATQKYGNEACKGGAFQGSFQYMLDNGGLDSEKDYPYTAGIGWGGRKCWKAASERVVATIANFSSVLPNSTDALMSALQVGPVSVAIEADKSIFQSYKSGVISNASACGTRLDHAVLLVGATSDSWIVKNSWGATWGEAGYVRLAVREGNPHGVCGINMAPMQAFSKPGKAPPVPPPTPGHPPALPCNCTDLCEYNCRSLFGLMCCSNAYNPPVLGHCTCGAESDCPKCKTGANLLAWHQPEALVV